MKKVLYEIECQRHNISPRQFFTYCCKQCAKKGIDIGCYVSYEEWINPTSPEEYHTFDHKDWDTPQLEANKYMPYDYQVSLQNAYNCIMEFQFDTETKGYGYFYLVEYER